MFARKEFFSVLVLCSVFFAGFVAVLELSSSVCLNFVFAPAGPPFPKLKSIPNLLTNRVAERRTLSWLSNLLVEVLRWTDVKSCELLK